MLLFAAFCLCCFALCYFFFWSSSPSFHFIQDFLNLLGFRLNAKTFLYCSKVIPNSIILLQNCLFFCWLQSSSFFERVPFFWHCYLFLNARNWFSTLNACVDALDILRLAPWRLSTCAPLLIFRFLNENLKWKTSQLKKKDLKMILSLSHNWTKPWRNRFHLFFLARAVWLYFIDF